MSIPNSNQVPFIPSTAPFNAEQRAWLNGFFVGLLSTAHGQSQEAPGTEIKTEPLLIAFGSQTGTAEMLAKKFAKEGAAHGFAATVKELNAVELSELSSAGRVLIVTSTWGDGDPPDNAAAFWAKLSAETAPRLENLSFGVLALGDKNYSNFCGAGKKMDERLEQLGAKRVCARVDCDVDYDAAAKEWINTAWSGLKGGSPGASAAIATIEPASTTPADVQSTPEWSRKNPFPARLIENRLLNSSGSEKETRHFTISLSGSSLKYQPGDALGVMPSNCPELVEEILRSLDVERDAPVQIEGGTACTLEHALRFGKEIRKPTPAFLQAFAERTRKHAVCELLPPERKADLEKYLYERELIDFLHDLPRGTLSADELLPLLPKLQPRLYSISSSQQAHPEEVHLTVAAVRYSTLGRKRKGVCSTFLADRALEGDVPVFLQHSHFKLPQNGDVPVIMVGPGTGIAPFRAFLEERRAMGASGKNWLFFGDQRRATDFLYREEIEDFISQGYLHRMETAFSRDQGEKVYVQHRMLQNAKELWSWLEAGAHFYVCGDAKRMAKDVDAALHQVIQNAGGKSAEQSSDYVQQMKQQKRYQRDVY